MLQTLQKHRFLLEELIKRDFYRKYKGSLLGSFGPAPRRMADLILDHGLCACVASDAHRPYERSTYMIRVRDYLAAEYGEEYMRLLLEENPARILSGRELLGYEPIPF